MPQPRILICLVFSYVIAFPAMAFQASDTALLPRSTTAEALRFIRETGHLDSSAHWPHIRPGSFLENLKINILTPLVLYQGSNTNFCGYAALSYPLLHDDPLGYARFMLALYHDGKASWGKIFFKPSEGIKQAAGTLRFKGVLDIRPADQLWFLLLADHFKGYLNFFNHHYDPGDENTFWAAMNYGKFNRIINRLLSYKVEARGTDLIRPDIPQLYEYLSNCLKTGITFLYVNNTFLHKKDHGTKFGFPTHFLVLTDISQSGDTLTITYWDYGGRSLKQVSTAFLKKILFGVTHCTKN
ncbi:MAG TPA: hypothetical protein VE035_10710 [Puia sp.]|nr:hypothetical protein [Puia sp.]